MLVFCGNVQDAYRTFVDNSDVAVIQMNIVLPEFDGGDDTSPCEIPLLKELPIAAVTAQSMKSEREKRIESGAWDYLSKPANPEQMAVVLRI